MVNIYDEQRIRKLVEDEFKNPEKSEVINFILKFLPILPSNLTFEEKVEIAKLNYRLLPILKVFTETIRNFKFVFDNNTTHMDTPMGFAILFQNKKIATINFYFKPTKEKLELHVNNIQSTNNQNNNLELEELTQILKINWRVYVIKRLKKFCNTHNIKLIGDLPPIFYTQYGELSTPKEYRRQLRQYIQTYLLGDLDINDINFDRMNTNDVEWVKRNLKIKQEREQGLRSQHQDKPKRVKLEHKPGTRRPMA